LRVMISLLAGPLFYLTNQRLGCYRITPRFDVCQQTGADELTVNSPSLSTQDDAEKNKEKGGRHETVRLNLEMGFF
ncbi:hypothetical protein GBF38_017480, partial [Nibea albiflora]